MTLLRDPVLGPLGTAQFISAFGSAMVGLALVYLSYDRTQSVFRTVLVTAAYALPSALFGVLAGRLAQHHSRRRILVASFSTKVVIYVAVAFFEAAVGLSANAILLLSLLNGTVGAFTYPAWQAFEKDVVPAERLAVANAFFASLTALAHLIGVAGGGFLLGAVGATAVFALNAASYVPELIVLARMHPEETYSSSRDAPPHQFAKAFAAIRSDAVLRKGFASLIAVSLLAAPVLQLLPGLAAEISREPHTLGILMGTFAVGGVAVTYVMKKVMHRGPFVVVSAGLGVIAAALVGFGLSNWLLDGAALYPPVLAGLLVLGLTIALVDSTLAAAVQSGAPGELEGTIFAIYGIVFTVLAPLSALILARLADSLDVYAVLAICGTMLLVYGLLERGPLRRMEQTGTAGRTHSEDHAAHPAHLLVGLVPRRMHHSAR